MGPASELTGRWLGSSSDAGGAAQEGELLQGWYGEPDAADPDQDQPGEQRAREAVARAVAREAAGAGDDLLAVDGHGLVAVGDRAAELLAVGVGLGHERRATAAGGAAATATGPATRAAVAAAAGQLGAAQD